MNDRTSARADSPASPPPTAHISRRRKLLFVLVMFVMLGGFAEIAARLIDKFTDVDVAELRERYRYRRMRRLESMWFSQRGDYPYLPFLPNARDRRINSLGFRGEEFSAEKPEGTYRIFCLGGSTTFDGYPEYLRKHLEGDFADRGLKLEVINAGDICWTSMESLINFITRCVPLKPDAIVVYHAHNDTVPAFGNTTSWDYSHWRGRLEKNQPVFWDKLPLFLDHSAAYVGFRNIFERRVATYGWNDMVIRYWVNFQDEPFNGVEPFRQNMFTLTSIARARGIETFLCTQVFNGEWKFKYSLERQEMAVGCINDITRSFADHWDDVHVIDVAGSLKGGNDWMTDNCHFTEAGKDRVAAFIADGIRPYLPRMVDRAADPMDVARLMPPANHPTPQALAQPSESR